MKCKYCDQELVEGLRFCPSCGKENLPEGEPVEAPAENVEAPAENVEIEEKTEMKEGIKMTPGKLALAITAAIALLAVLVALIISGINGKQLSYTDGDTVADETTTIETLPEETVPATIPADGNPDDATCKGSYTVTDEEIIAAADEVVATMGDKTLTNGQLQVFYWMEVMNFLSNYGEYVSYFGLDYTQPLDTQLCEDGSDNPMTWQQYFLTSALESWMSYQALSIEAEANNIQLDEIYSSILEALPAEMQANAEAEGLESAEELIKLNMGAGATMEDYYSYIRMYYEGYNYFGMLYDEVMPDTAEIEAYFAENEAAYEEAGITKDSGKYVDVRHVLLMPEDENASTGVDGYPVYSEEAWEACRVKAQELYDQWLAGDKSEGSFAQMAMEHTEDGNGAEGGLYTDVTEGYMVETFNDWCFDEARQIGDHGLVKTQYGYHIMYFSGSTEIWFATAESDLVDERANGLLPACIERNPATIDYSLIKLGLADLDA